MQVIVESANEVVLEVEDVLFVDGDMPLLVNDADHLVVRRLYWLFELGGN